MTIKEALNIASKRLSSSIENPRKEAMLLLEFFLQKDRLFLITNETFDIDNEDKYFRLVQKRLDFTPLEYIVGKVSFYSHEFYINSGVLIPRPETELLVEKAIEHIKKNSIKEVAEIGVGSGIISIMLALMCKDVKIKATDINKEALKLAKKNAIKHNVEDRIELINTSLLDGVEIPELLISNPPYISQKELLEKHVLNEPHNALFGGEVGDEILKKISLIYKSNEKIKVLMCEMGYNQKESMDKFFKDERIDNYCFYKDFSGFDRGFIITKER